MIESDGSSPLKPGDGIVFDAADWRSPQEPEEGGRIYEIGTNQTLTQAELRFGNGAIDAARIRPGDLVWRTGDPALAKAVRALPAHKQPVRIHAVARVGEPLTLAWRIGDLSVTTRF